MELSLKRLDRLSQFLLLAIFVLLPFAVTDNSMFLYYVSRGFYCFLGALCLTSLFLNKKKEYLKYFFIFSALLLIPYFLNPYPFAYKEYFTLIIGMLIYFWAKDQDLRFFIKCIIYIVLFHVFNTVVQLFLGQDLFGFPTHRGRHWGAFRYGAPSLGVFLGAFLVLPYIYIKQTIKAIIYSLVIFLGILLSKDRAPLVQLCLAIPLFLPVKLNVRVIIIVLSSFVLWQFHMSFPDLLPSKIKLLQQTFLAFFLSSDWSFVSELGNYLSIDQYIYIWETTLKVWLEDASLIQKLFGVGWGNTPHFLAEFSDVRRPHSIYLDLLTSLGILGSSAITYFLYRKYRFSNWCFFIFSFSILPFSFFSLFSFNWFFIILINLALFPTYKKNLGKPF